MDNHLETGEAYKRRKNMLADFPVLRCCRKGVQLHKMLPSALTEQRKFPSYKNYPCYLLKVSRKSFITSELSDAVACFSAREDVILSPPVHRSYECQQYLSPYYSCQVRCYTRTGAMHDRKFTLRCTRKLLYNYAQYGNKHELGFRYYPFQRDFVEASGTTYMERNLLEL